MYIQPIHVPPTQWAVRGSVECMDTWAAGVRNFQSLSVEFAIADFLSVGGRTRISVRL